MTSNRAVAFLDTETTKLARLRRPWEIALILRPAGGRRADDVEHHWFIDLADVHLWTADPIALNIGRFYQRHPDIVETSPNASDPLSHVLVELERLTRGAVIAGSNPAFDTDMLDRLMRERHVLPSWYHHPEDVPTLVRGWLAGKGLTVPAERKTDQILASAGLNLDQYARHTAMGDCRLFRDGYDLVEGDV